MENEDKVDTLSKLVLRRSQLKVCYEVKGKQLLLDAEEKAKIASLSLFKGKSEIELLPLGDARLKDTLEKTAMKMVKKSIPNSTGFLEKWVIRFIAKKIFLRITS